MYELNLSNMMKRPIIFVLFCSSFFSFSQVETQEVIHDTIVEMLPTYLVITSENTKLIGGINIVIDYKKSRYEPALEELEFLLQNRKKMKIRNQTDLLNVMYELGYEFIDAYNATSGTLGAGAGDNVDVFGSESKFRTNMVFKKMKQ